MTETEMDTGRKVGRRVIAALSRLRRRPDAVVTSITLTLLALLTMLAISGSSLPALSPSGEPDEASLLLGQPRSIRSDEYIVSTPLKLGQVYAEFPDARLLGMGYTDVSDSWRNQLPTRSIGHAIFSPFNTPFLLLPPANAVAAYWWLPFFAALLATYFWFRRLGSRWEIALPAGLLIVSAPVAVWWSGWQLQSIAHAAGACALLMSATNWWPRSRAKSLALTFSAVLVVAGLPWTYQPWAIVAALFTGAVTAAWGLSTRERRRAFLMTAAIFLGLFLAASAAYLMHELDYYRALAGTAYPGSRRFGGGGGGIGRFFSSLFAASVNGVDGRALKGTNLSEFSTGWTIVLPVAIGIMVFARSALRSGAERGLLVGAAMTSIILGSWTIIRWPSVLAQVTLLNFVSPGRLVPYLGFFGITALVLLSGDDDRWNRIQGALDGSSRAFLVVMVLGLTAWAATEVKMMFLPTISAMTVVLTATVAMALTWLLVSGRRFIAVGCFAAISSLIAAFVNPLTTGVGAIRHSPAAVELRSFDDAMVRPTEGTWAVDDLRLVALVNGNGFDALSSFNDPVDESGWRVLDPEGRFETEWNRLGYILFRWAPGRQRLVIENPVTDIVLVRIDPCDPKLDRLGLTALISSRPIFGSCLLPVTTFDWDGRERTVWRRLPTG